MIRPVFISETIIIVSLVAMLGCSPMITEFGDSSGCLWTEGGPVPGFSSGKVLVCRSGKDKATVRFADETRAIVINHGEDSDLKAEIALLKDKIEKIMLALSAVLKAMVTEEPKKESAF